MNKNKDQLMLRTIVNGIPSPETLSKYLVHNGWDFHVQNDYWNVYSKNTIDVKWNIQVIEVPRFIYEDYGRRVEEIIRDLARLEDGDELKIFCNIKQFE